MSVKQTIQTLVMPVEEYSLADINNFCVEHGTELILHNNKPFIKLMEVIEG